METFVSAVKSLLLSWYQITVDNFDYFIAVASLTGLLLCWLVSLCFRSRWGTQKQYFEKQQKALYQEYDITWHSLENAAHQMQQLKEELLIKDSHIDQITKDSQANQIMAKRAVDLDAQLARRNNELSQLVSMLEAESGIGGQLPAIDGLDSDALWQRHVEAAKQLAERMRHNQQLASELQQTQQGLSTQIAEQQADILDLQQSLTAKDGQIGQLTDEIETQKALASDKLSHIQEDLSAQIAEQQAAIQNLQQVLTARDSQISELTEEVESQKTIALNEFNQTQQDLSAQIAAQQIAIKDLQGALTAKDSQIGQLTADLESQKSIAKQELAKAPALLAAKEKAVVTEQIQQADKNSGASFDSAVKVTKTVDAVGNAETEQSGVNVAKPTVAESVQKISVAETVAKQRAAANTIVEKPSVSVKSSAKPEKKSWLTTLKSKLKTSEAPKGKPVASAESVDVGSVAATVLEPAKEILQEAASVVEFKVSESTISSDSAANAGVGVETTTSELSSQTAALAAQETESVDAISTVQAVVQPDENLPASSEVSDKTVAITELPSKSLAKKKSWFSPISAQFSTLIGKDKQTEETPKQPDIEQTVENTTVASTEQVLTPEILVTEITVDVLQDVDAGGTATNNNPVAEESVTAAEVSSVSEAVETVKAEGYPITEKKSWISTITKQLKFSQGSNKSNYKPVNLEPETLTDSLSSVGGVDETVMVLVDQAELPDESFTQDISSTDGLGEIVVEEGTSNSESIIALDVVEASDQENVDDSTRKSAKRLEKSELVQEEIWAEVITGSSEAENSGDVVVETEVEENSIVDSIIDVLGLTEEAPVDSIHMNYVRTLDDIAIGATSGQAESESSVDVSDVVEISQSAVGTSESENAEVATESSETEGSEVVVENELVEEGSTVDLIIDVLGLTEEAPVDSIHMNYVRTLDDIAIGSTSGQVESKSSVDVSDVVEISQGAAETSEAEDIEVATDSSEAESSGVVAENELVEEGFTVDSIIDVLGLAEEAPVDSIHMDYVRTLDDIAIGSTSGQVESESSVDVSETVEEEIGNVVQSASETSEAENAEVTTDSSEIESSGIVAENELAGEGSTVDLIIDVLGLTEEAPVDSIHMNYVRTLDDIAIGSTSGQVESESSVAVSDVVEINQSAAETNEAENAEVVTDRLEAEGSGVVAENELAGEGSTVDLIIDVLGLAEEEAPVDSIHMDYVRTLDDIAIGSTSGQAESESFVDVPDVVEISQSAAETSEVENAQAVTDRSETERFGVTEAAPIDSIHMNYVRTLDDIAIGSSSGQAESESSVDVADVVEISQSAAETSEVENAQAVTDHLETERFGVTEAAPIDSIHMNYVRTLDDIAIAPKPAKVETESFADISQEVGARLLDDDSEQMNAAEVAQFLEASKSTAIDGISIADVLGLSEDVPEEPVYMDYVRTLDDIAIAVVAKATVNAQLSAETAANLDGEITPELITAETKIGEQAKLEPIYMDYVRSFEDIAVSSANNLVQVAAGEQDLKADNLENREGHVFQEPQIASQGSWLNVIKGLIGVDTASQSELVYMDYVRSMDDISLSDRKSENKAQEEEIPEVVKVENASLLGSFKRLFGLNQRS